MGTVGSVAAAAAGFDGVGGVRLERKVGFLGVWGAEAMTGVAEPSSSVIAPIAIVGGGGGGWSSDPDRALGEDGASGWEADGGDASVSVSVSASVSVG